MRQIVSNVTLVEGLRGSNVYLLSSSQGLTLVDTGMASDAGRIVAQLEGAGHALSEMRAIVLTHTHGDHAGGAEELARLSGAQVLAHQDEVPYIEQTQPLPADSAAKRLLFWLGDHMVFRLSPCQVDRPLEDGDVIPALGGTDVIHTPGHTPGSIALYQTERRILFCGDALFNANPATGRPGLRLPPPLVTLDTAQARESVRKLSTLAVEVLCCGHGEPILEGAAEKISALLKDRDV